MVIKAITLACIIAGVAILWYTSPHYNKIPYHTSALSVSVASAQASLKLEMAGFYQLYLQCYETKIFWFAFQLSYFCKGTSIRFLTAPTLPLFICIFPHTFVPSPGTTPKADDLRIQSPTTFRMSTHRKSSTLCSFLSTASDELWMHWDMSMWHYSTLCCHVDGY
jgi:hypothetical protein